MAFVIKNTTDRDVVLDDLRVILGPFKQIDLDRVAPRHLIDSSPKLRLAFQQRRVVTVNQDGIGIGEEVNDNGDLKSMEARLKADFRKQLAALQRQQPAAPAVDSSKLEELQATIQKLVLQLANQPLQVTPSHNQDGKPAEAQPSSSGDGISDDIATRLHAKSMQRLAKKVTGSGNSEHEAKTIKDETLNKNINELEGLL